MCVREIFGRKTGNVGNEPGGPWGGSKIRRTVRKRIWGRARRKKKRKVLQNVRDDAALKALFLRKSPRVRGEEENSITREEDQKKRKKAVPPQGEVVPRRFDRLLLKKKIGAGRAQPLPADLDFVPENPPIAKLRLGNKGTWKEREAVFLLWRREGTAIPRTNSGEKSFPCP